VFIANVLKSRPPDNRDPRPDEIAACEPYLWRQIALIQPRVVCTLGNFATKLLSGEPTGITRVRGRAQLRELGGRAVYLYPIFHPAAALYTPAMLATLREDIVKLPELLASPLPESALPEPAGEGAGTPVERAVDSGALSAAGGGVDPGPTEQLGLF
jgi:DNA polymerase